MAINSRLLFFTVFLLIGLSFVSAQSAGFFINTEDGQPRFVQRLVWSGGEYALRYEVLIERETSGAYRNYHREFTTELYINISLQPGNYRFRVTPFDILNRQGQASEWKYIVVLPALRPELFTVSSEYTLVDGASGFLLNLAVNNVDPDAEIFVRNVDLTVQLRSMRAFVETSELTDVNEIKIFIESEHINPGEYEILIRNPGGLEASIGGVLLFFPEHEIAVEPEPLPELDVAIEPEPEIEELPEPEKELKFGPLKTMIFSAGFAYIPSFPIYGDLLSNGIAVLGLTFRANLLFYLPIGIYIGPELSAFASYINYPIQNEIRINDYYDPDSMVFYNGNFFTDNFNFDRLTLTAGINFLARKWFAGQQAALSFRLGADYGFLPDWLEQINIRMDFSILWRFEKNYLLEAGLDYSHILAEYSGAYFRPWLSVSYQF